MVKKIVQILTLQHNKNKKLITIYYLYIQNIEKKNNNRNFKEM